MARAHAPIRDGTVPAPSRHGATVASSIVGGGVAGLARRVGAAPARRSRDVVVLELDDVVGRHRARRRVRGHAVSVGRALHRRAAAANSPSSPRCSARWARSRATPATARRRRRGAALPRARGARVLRSAAGGRACTSRPARPPRIARSSPRFAARSIAGARGAMPQGRRAFAIPRSRATDDPEVTALDRISFAAWLDARKLTSPRLRWLCDYACRDDYALPAAETSAWAGAVLLRGAPARPRARGADGRDLARTATARSSRQLAKSATIEQRRRGRRHRPTTARSIARRPERPDRRSARAA